LLFCEEYIGATAACKILVKLTTGTILNGVPIYCGGQKNNESLYSRYCYKYNKEGKNWTQAS